MNTNRSIEIFSAGCKICKEMITQVKRLACPFCQVTILDVTDESVSRHAKQLAIRTIPAVVVDGQLA